MRYFVTSLRENGKKLMNWINRIRLNSTGDYYIEEQVQMQHSRIEKYVSISKDCNIVWSIIGKYTYIGPHTELPYCKIGAFCSIASHVILAEGMHPTQYVSMHPVMYGGKGYRLRGGIMIPYESSFHEHNRINEESRTVCEIGNDVWIATGVIIAIGKKPIHIGDGAVIAAGAVVTGDVPNYAIVGGCPARILGYRFDKPTREKLYKIKWWEKDTDWINAHIEMYDDIEKFIEFSSQQL